MINLQQPFQLMLTPRSPFARRIKITLLRLNLQFEEIPVEPFVAPEKLVAKNPLGLVPTLFHPNLGWISDSNNILEILDDNLGLIWPKGAARVPVRQASVWGVGIMQAAVGFFMETKMVTTPSSLLIKEYWTTIEDTLTVLNGLELDIFRGALGWTQAGWDLAVALDYCSFRIPEMDWKKKHLRLATLHAQILEELIFQNTRPKH